MKNERQRGSITVEATLFLPIFFLAFVSIYNLVYFARAQVIVQYAADQAAKEVAQYSYILEKTGILDAMDNLNKNNQEFKSDIESVRKNLETIQSAGEQAISGQDVIQNGMEIGDAVQEAYDTVKAYADDPSSFINGLLGCVKEFTYEEISYYMINNVASACIDKQLRIAGGIGDPEVYKEKLGITRISVSETRWCKNQSRDIKIVVDYYISNNVPFFRMEPRHYRVCASTRVWSGV